MWITSIVSNRVIRLAPSGAYEILLEDFDPDHLTWVEQAYQAGEMDRPHMDGIMSRVLRSVSSLCFGGTDLRRLWFGCLLGDRIGYMASPVTGRPPAHWHFPW